MSKKDKQPILPLERQRAMQKVVYQGNLPYSFQFIKHGMTKGIDARDVNQEFECDIYAQNKMTHLPFPKASSRKLKPCDMIHSDASLRTPPHELEEYFFARP